jgi:ferredoxin/coenzyme F420-reducing hydrogenase delta subunit
MERALHSPVFGPSRNPVAGGIERIERRLDALYGAASNPLRHLGTIGFLLFWVIAVTGGYLYAVFDTSAAGAYRSTEALSTNLLGFGAVVRALHRYASDAFVVVMLLHLVRELAFGRVSGFRRFTWLTGVPLVWLTFAAGIVGFWLVWDQVAAMSAVATTEWLDALGVFGESLARNFLSGAAVNDRLFSLLVFLHVGLPLLLLAGMWIHVQRLARPDTRTARPLTLGILVTLVLLSIAQPAPLAAPADLARLPEATAFDWFYLAPNALSDRGSSLALWLLAGGATVALFLLPWLVRTARAPAAVVDPANCNGCSRCFEDCPYAAVTMTARGEGGLAVVDPDLCAGCGICAGACPSATPFRSITELASGIDLPHDPVDRIRRALTEALAAARDPVIAFGCRHGADLRALASVDVGVIPLECAGQLPPAMVEYALRHGASGVAVARCPDGACEYRLGDRWTQARLAGDREPHLRASVPRDRVLVIEAGAGEERAVGSRLAQWRPLLRQAQRTASHG